MAQQRTGEEAAAAVAALRVCNLAAVGGAPGARGLFGQRRLTSGFCVTYAVLLMLSSETMGGAARGTPAALLQSSLDLRTLLPALILACAGLLGLAVWKTYRHNRCMRTAAEADRQRALFLADASHLFGSSLDLQTVLDTVSRKATEVLGDYCAILLLKEGETVLKVASSSARGEGEPGQGVPDFMREHPIQLGEGVVGTVAETGEPLLVPDYPSSPHALEAYAQRLGVRSCLAVPIRVEGSVIGVLVSGHNRADRVPTEADLRLATLIADRAGVAIERARLYRRLEELVEERTRALAVSQDQLLEAERAQAVSELAAMVAHEVRNPLNVAKTAAYFIGQRVRGQDPRVDRHLGLMEQHVDTAARVIDDLVDYGAFREPNQAAVELGGLAMDVVDGLEAPASAHGGIRASVEPAWVWGDRGQLCRAVKTLLLNAVQASDGSQPVQLEVCLEEGQSVVEVCHVGARVPEADWTRVFDPLYGGQLQGIGLGLALTRRIFEENGGGISYSHNAVGATFRAWLPAIAPGGTGPRAQPAPSASVDAEEDEAGESNPNAVAL